jgi:phage gpG-like protein
VIAPKIQRIDSTEVKQRFAKLKARGKDLREPLFEIGEIGLSSIKENFRVGGRYSEPGSWRGGSKKWEPLAESTKRKVVGGRKGYTKKGNLRAESKRKLAKRKVLIKSAQLKNSITKHVTKELVALGTNKPYAAAQNYGVDKVVTVKRKSKTVFGTKRSGSSSHKRHMRLPARPYMVLQEEDIEDSIDALDDYLMQD